MAEIYEYEIDLNADTSHTRSILLTGHGKRVLEFGCATGYISKILTEQFGCTVTGVELNPDAAAKAARRCHRVLCGDAETFDYAKELDGERFDVVLFQDVLEHLKDPAALLRKIRDFIEPGGYVVASIPNIAHAAVALELMSGRFAYRPWGLLDDTHLRFFSRVSIYDLFESTGYLIAELSRIEIAPPATEFQTKLSGFPREVVEFALAQDEADTYQFILKAYPSVEAGVLAALRTKVAAAQQVEVERAAEVTALRQELETTKGALAAQQAEVAQARRELDAGEVIAQLRQQLEVTAGRLAQREVEAGGLSRDLEATRATVTTQQAELESTRAGMTAAQADLSQLRQRLEAGAGLLAQREAEAGGLSRDLEASRGALTTQQAEAARVREELESTRAIMAAGQADISQLRQELEAAARRLAQRETEAAELSGELRATKSALAAHEAEAARVRKQLQSTREAVATGEVDLSRLRQELHGLGQELAAIRSARADEHAINEGLGAVVRATRASARAVVSSPSWKVAKPLRQLIEVLSYARKIGLTHTARSMLTAQFTKGLHFWRHLAVIEHSGLFDPAWYLAQNPDVAGANIEPIRHYLAFGAAEGRDPNPLFDSSWYLEHYPDVGRAGLNPLVHYALRGALEGRHPHPRFEAAAEREPHAAVEMMRPTPFLHGRQLTAPLNPSACLPVNDDGPWLMCVSHVRPDPPRAGNEYRLQRMLRWAANKGYRVLLVHAPLPDDEPSEEVLGRLAAIYPHLVVCSRDGMIHYRLEEAGAAGAAIARLAGRPARAFPEDPVSGGDQRASELHAIARTFAHDSLIETVLALDDALKPKVVLVNYVFMTRFLPRLGSGALKVVDTIDVFSSRQAKVERYGVPDGLALTPDEEACYLARADIIVAIQAEEAHALGRLAPGKRVVTAGVDFDLVALPSASEGKIVLLIASDNAMNVKGAQDFLRFAWPLIKRQIPDAEFWMAGKVSQAVTFDGAGVHALGQIDDVTRLYRAARVTINPSVAGTGVKIKTLESLSRLRPVVCWPAGAEGLAVELQPHCHVVENWYEFAVQVTQSLQGEGGHRALWTAQDRVAELLGSETVYGDLGDALLDHSVSR